MIDEKMPETEPYDSQYDLVLLDPTRVELFRAGSVVRAVIDDPKVGYERCVMRVQIARAFPFSRPDDYIGLRDGRDKDIGVFPLLEGMAKESRAIIAEELERRYFLPKIQSVTMVKEEGAGITKWNVNTDRGGREFFVQNIRESVMEIAPGRLLMTDVEGNRYEFPNVRALDEKVLSVLQRVL